MEHGTRGLTLIEVVITVAVLGLVSVTGLMFINSAYEAQRVIFQEAQAASEARRGLKAMIAEMREARPGDDGSYILQTANDQELAFFSDADRDGQTERIRYYLNGLNLMRGVIPPQATAPTYPQSQEQSAVIAQFVRNGASALFIYYNGDWPADATNNPLPAPARLSDTKLIHLHLVVDIEPFRAPVNYDLQGDVQIRNLKTNL